MAGEKDGRAPAPVVFLEEFPDDLGGLTVLDIGTGSGWFATWFEQQGARVTTVDVRGYCDFDVFGRDRNPPVTEEKASPDRILEDGRAVYYSPVSGGFWAMKELLGLQVEYVNGRVYEIGPELLGPRTFDLVFMGSVLMHLREDTPAHFNLFNVRYIVAPATRPFPPFVRPIRTFADQLPVDAAPRIDVFGVHVVHSEMASIK